MPTPTEHQWVQKGTLRAHICKKCNVDYAKAMATKSLECPGGAGRMKIEPKGGQQPVPNAPSPRVQARPPEPPPFSKKFSQEKGA